MMLDKNLKEIIFEYAETVSSNISALALYGSYAIGTAKKDSDIDLLILDEKNLEPFRCQQVYKGYLMQTTVVSSELALELLQNSPRQSHPFYPVSWEMSHILIDKFGIALYLKKNAKRILSLGPVQATDQEVESKRISLINYLNNGAKAKYVGNSFVESVKWAAKCIEICEDMLVLTSNEWRLNNPRFKRELLNSKYPKFVTIFHDALDNLMKSGETKTFALDIKNVMQQVISLDENSTLPHCSVI